MARRTGISKRSPELNTKDHFRRYAKVSKADIIEAYRDLFREMGGEGELDDEKWFNDLEHRIEILKSYRAAGTVDGAAKQV